MPEKVKYARRHTPPALKKALRHYSAKITGVPPYCDMVANMSARDFDNLVDEIEKNGMLHKLLVDKTGLLLDGRNRLRACFLLGVPIADDQIEVTDASPVAIANSNIARRHLTIDQRVMIAVDTLQQDRQNAAARKRDGQEKGRNNRKSSLDAKRASNQTTKSRKPRSLENVAKQLGVPRKDLSVAEKVAAKNPAVAQAVKNGKISLGEAAGKSGIKQKDKADLNTSKKPRKRTSSAVGSQVRSTETKYSDQLTIIHDQSDGLRVVTCGNLRIFQHPTIASKTIIAGHRQDGWWVENTEGGHRCEAKAEEDATRLAMSMIAEQLKEAAS